MKQQLRNLWKILVLLIKITGRLFWPDDHTQYKVIDKKFFRPNACKVRTIQARTPNKKKAKR